MVHVPQDAKWYVAELIEEIAVEGDTRTIVHKNLVLIESGSPEEAFLREATARLLLKRDHG